MTIRLLGTGAAEGVPAFFSDSRVSLYAREHGGREIRTRCGALIDGHLKIDFPPDTICHLQRDGLDSRDWSALFFTHGHDDHFAIQDLQYGLYPFSEELAYPFTIFGNETIVSQIQAQYPDWPFDLQMTRSFEAVFWAEYTITPIHARHMEGEQDAQNLIIADGEKTLLYATDTGVWLEPTWEFLSAFRLDGLVMECTAGRVESDYTGHHSLSTFFASIERLKVSGILKPDAAVVSTHHSHNGDLTYAELVELLEPHGVVAGYDGFEFQI